MTSTASLQVGIVAFQVLGHVVAVRGVVGHHEQDGLLAHLFVLGIRLAPLDHAQVEIVGVLLGVLGALPLRQLGAAGGIGQHGVLDDVLRDGLHQRVIGHGLHEDRAVVVLGRGGHVHLQRERGALLQQPVVDVLDGLEPGHACGSWMWCASSLSTISSSMSRTIMPRSTLESVVAPVGRLPEEIVHRVVVVGRRRNVVAGVDAVDVGQEDVAGRVGDAHLVLHVQGQLKIVAPVAPVQAVVGQDRVVCKKMRRP